MSVETCIYFGPYVLVKNKIEIVAETERMCTNKDCIKYKKVVPQNLKFCSECGFILKDKEKSKNEEVSAYQFLFEKKEFIDKLFCASNCGENIIKGYDALCPNQRIEGVKDIKIDFRGGTILDIHETKDQDLILFQNQYHKELEYLSSNGFELTFIWGLIIYFW